MQVANVLTIVDIRCRDKEGSKLWLWIGEGLLGQHESEVVGEW